MVTSLDVYFELLLLTQILALKLGYLCSSKQVPLNIFPWKVQLGINEKAFTIVT